MKIFLDTADLQEIEHGVSLGVVSGVTTNPTLLSTKGPIDFKSTIQRICDLVKGPVSTEVLSTEASGMVEEALEYSAWSPYVVVKLPMTEQGLKALHRLRTDCGDRNVRVNVTLVFSPNQALLAAIAGATYVSPFLGRLDDVGHDGMQVVRDSVEIFQRYQLPTQVLAASIRHPLHCVEAAKAGAHIATMPYKVLMAMVKHPLTDVGLERFLADWRQARQLAPVAIT